MIAPKQYSQSVVAVAIPEEVDVTDKVSEYKAELPALCPQIVKDAVSEPERTFITLPTPPPVETVFVLVEPPRENTGIE
jgi:hypothetical protein